MQRRYGVCSSILFHVFADYQPSQKRGLRKACGTRCPARVCLRKSTRTGRRIRRQSSPSCRERCLTLWRDIDTAPSSEADFNLKRRLSLESLSACILFWRRSYSRTKCGSIAAEPDCERPTGRITAAIAGRLARVSGRNEGNDPQRPQPRWPGSPRSRTSRPSWFERLPTR